MSWKDNFKKTLGVEETVRGEKKRLQFCSDVPTTKTRKTPKHVEAKADSMAHAFPVTRVKVNIQGEKGDPTGLINNTLI